MHWKIEKGNVNVHFDSHTLCEIDEGDEGVVDGPRLTEVLRGGVDGDVCDVRQGTSAVFPF